MRELMNRSNKGMKNKPSLSIKIPLRKTSLSQLDDTNSSNNSFVNNNE